MASRRAAFAPLSVLRTSVDFDFSSDSSSLQAGQRLAKPGLPGFNSNSSPQTAQTLMGNAMLFITEKNWKHVADRSLRRYLYEHVTPWTSLNYDLSNSVQDGFDQAPSIPAQSYNRDLPAT